MSLIFELAGYGFSAAVVSLLAAVRFGFNQDHHLHCETFFFYYVLLSVSFSGSSFAIQLFVRWEKMQGDKDQD